VKDNEKQVPPLRAFRLTPDLDRQLSDIQKETGLSRSVIIRSGVELVIARFSRAASTQGVSN